MCALALRSTPDPALAGIRDRLTQQFALHRRTAPFWTAYQGLQQEVIHAHMSGCATPWPTSPKTSVQ